jgi:hypothetical protein
VNSFGLGALLVTLNADRASGLRVWGVATLWRENGISVHNAIVVLIIFLHEDVKVYARHRIFRFPNIISKFNEILPRTSKHAFAVFTATAPAALRPLIAAL